MTKLSILNSIGEKPIPDRSSTPPTSQPSLDRTYTLSMKAAMGSKTGDLELYFLEYPSDYKPGKDGPLEMSVPKAFHGGRIILKLDPYWNWHFRGDGPQVTLGVPAVKPNPPAEDRYSYLRPLPVPSTKCMEVSFFTDYLNDKTQYGNRDSFNIYVDFDEGTTGGGTISSLSIKIDPDIRNPGDPPQIIGSAKKRSKKKGSKKTKGSKKKA